jgi:hypothetical protein
MLGLLNVFVLDPPLVLLVDCGLASADEASSTELFASAILRISSEHDSMMPLLRTGSKREESAFDPVKTIFRTPEVEDLKTGAVEELSSDNPVRATGITKRRLVKVLVVEVVTSRQGVSVVASGWLVPVPNVFESVRQTERTLADRSPVTTKDIRSP